MTSVDETVAHDLAALAADSRRDRRSAEDALRAALARAHREANPVPIDRQLAVVHAARVFAARVARAAAGAVAMLCAIAVIAVLHAPGLDRAPGTPPAWWVWPVDGNAAAIAMLMATLASGAYIAAGSLAGRWIESRWRRAAARASAADLAAMPGPRMARLLDAAAVALPVAGATCALVVVGVLAWTAGRQPVTRLWLDGAEVGPMFADRLRDLTIAVPSAIAAAAALGLACARRARWAGFLERRGTAWLGVALALIAIRVAAVHHLGPLSANAALAASSPLRTALTAAGALAAFLVAAGVALRQHRRELRCLEAAPGELQPADGELVALAGVLRSRAARAAAGGVAAMLAVGLTVMLHHPRPALSSGFHVLQLGSRLPWLVGGQGTLLVAVAALVLGAMQLGPAIADRWLARRLARCPTAEGPDARLALARQFVRRVDPASLGLAVAGGAALVLVIAIVGLTIGDMDWAFFSHHGPRVDATLRHLRHEVVAAVAASFTAGLALAEAACARRARRMACGLAWLAHPAVIVAGALLGKLVSVAWMHLDLGVSYMSAAVDSSSRALQTGLTAALTGAVLVVASGLALRRRRREHERTNQTLRGERLDP